MPTRESAEAVEEAGEVGDGAENCAVAEVVANDVSAGVVDAVDIDAESVEGVKVDLTVVVNVVSVIVVET